MLATEAARETVRIALATEVVRAYYGLIALDAQVAATRRSLALRSDGLALQKVRNTAGLINDFTLRQLEAEVAAAQAQLPALEATRTAQELALAVLLGRSPRAIMEGAVARSAEQGGPATPVVPCRLTRCPDDPLNVSRAFCPGPVSVTSTPEPPGVIEPVTSAGTELSVNVIVPVEYVTGSTKML